MESMNEPRDKNGLTEKEFLAAYKPGNWPRTPAVAISGFDIHRGMC